MHVKLCHMTGLYFLLGGDSMLKAQLYFLSDQYYLDFPDDKLMKNKDMLDGSPHNRPCFFAFPDSRLPSIYWIIPISSQYEKFKKIEQEKRKGTVTATRYVLELFWEEIPPF